ncbi:related to HFB30 [Cephalotrichum gorgonifer]|uniref:RBR-type E3 ubiquitin transferase n=1 Tax=Cephalotrichum gorgonifer TaxID=2041049 RepID=A0AAE8MSI8_9PEZI|nr:related to HFB30 [Cephalotrichum gorgonifer]
MEDGPDDLRLEELASLEAIFPEIQRPYENDQFTFTLELPVKPPNPITVRFRTASATTTSSNLTEADAAAAEPRQGPGPAANADGAADLQNRGATFKLSYLPSVSLRMTLPSGYPSHKPPKVDLGTRPEWLPAAVIKNIEADAHRLWEEMGRDMVAYTYIDHVQQAAEDVFGMMDSSDTVELAFGLLVFILDYDIKARRAAFVSETFDCGICLDPKKGISCHKMTDCGHVFCISCLQDFYSEAIRQGDVNLVRCLSPGCAKAREEAQASDSGKVGRKTTVSISPGELLALGLSEDIVSRYVSLKYKMELESDKATVYCPRKWCDGAAVSKRHKKPKGLELQEPEGDEIPEADDARDDDANGKAAKSVSKTEELLAICEDCSYAFCTRCMQSWHGEFVHCWPKVSEDLTPEEKASLEYIRMWTRPCASCDAPTQKTEGCNHMICYRCNTHFCYLCSAWLNPQNPYSHFNSPGEECYQRLWEFYGGHGENRDQRDGAARRAPPRAAVIRERPDEEPQRQPGDGNVVGEDNGGGHDGPGLNNGDAVGEHVQVAREGPLVLRIEQQGRREVVPPAPAPAPPAAPAGRGGRRRGRGGGPGVAGRPNPHPHPHPHPHAQERGGQRNANGGRGRGHIRQNRQAHPEHNQARQPRRGAQERGEGNNGQPAAQVGPMENGPDLNEQQRAWVRRFVQLALVDEEDSSSEDEGLDIF